MTEQEWLATERPWLLLHAVHSWRPSEGKVRLFNAALCRRFWDHLPESSQAILSESEVLADGLVQATDEMAEASARPYSTATTPTGDEEGVEGCSGQDSLTPFRSTPSLAVESGSSGHAG